MRVAVFGYGSMGRRRADILASLGHEVWVCDPVRPGGVEEHVNAPFGVVPPHTWWTSDPDLLWRVSAHEAVVICTPAHLHADLLWQCVDRGLPVLVEKPLATSVSALVHPDVNQQGAMKSVVRVGYQMRHLPGVSTLRHHIANTVGEVVTARFVTGSNLATWPGSSYADALLECSHEIDMALHLLGPATCRAATSRRDGAAWELMLEHKSGVVSTVSMNYAQADYLRSWAVRGTKGSAAIAWCESKDGDPPRIETRASIPPREWQPVVSALAEAYRRETEAFMAAAASATGPWSDPSCTVAEALQVLTICDRARELAR